MGKGKKGKNVSGGGVRPFHFSRVGVSPHQLDDDSGIPISNYKADLSSIRAVW